MDSKEIKKSIQILYCKVPVFHDILLLLLLFTPSHTATTSILMRFTQTFMHREAGCIGFTTDSEMVNRNETKPHPHAAANNKYTTGE